LKEAIENPELEKLFERYRKSPESFVFAPLADACRKIGRLEEALEICSRGVKLHPNYPTGHVVLGKCLFDMGRQEEALEAFRRVLTLDGENMVALKYVGLIAAAKGEVEEAKEKFQRILALDPDNKEIRTRLRELEQGEEEEEFLELRPVDEEEFEGQEIRLGEEDVETSDELATMTLADIFAAQGYREKALKIYREVLRRDPDNQKVKEKIAALSARSREPALEKMVDDLPLEEPAPEPSPEPPAQETSSPPRKPPSPAQQETRSEPPPGRPIDEKESLEHFRRWLERMDGKS